MAGSRAAAEASFRHRSINRNSAVASGSSFFNGWRSTPGTTPLTSQLALLISTTMPPLTAQGAQATPGIRASTSPHPDDPSSLACDGAAARQGDRYRHRDRVTYGFELIREQKVAEINSTARQYRHVCTGAELLSLLNNDENKVFGVIIGQHWRRRP
jgi:hypothetical protein